MILGKTLKNIKHSVYIELQSGFDTFQDSHSEDKNDEEKGRSYDMQFEVVNRELKEWKKFGVNPKLEKKRYRP